MIAIQSILVPGWSISKNLLLWNHQFHQKKQSNMFVSNTLYSNTTDVSKLPVDPDLFSYYKFYIISTLLIRTFLSRIHWLCWTLFIAPKSENYVNLPFFSRTSRVESSCLFPSLALCKVMTSLSLNLCHWCKCSVFITIFVSTQCKQ
jgi:hypothetical protein